jgi:lysylphosphatidylglycerol synthetase-like protein (DUF2156 family)
VNDRPISVAPRLRARERVVVHGNGIAARWLGALALLSATCWLIILLAREPDHGFIASEWDPDGRLAWSLTVFAGVALIARGVFLGRPVTALHATAALAVLVSGLGARLMSVEVPGDLLVVAAGLVLMWPTGAPPEPEQLPRVWALVSATSGDPLAPFAMHELKSYHFNAEGTAAIAYRTRMGYAVVSGDPIGDEDEFPALVGTFAALCHSRGWRIVVLGCSERRAGLWSDPAVVGRTLRPVPIGRDVVVDVARFEMAGRRFRNLRQAVARTHNAGINTEVVAERALDAIRLAELTDVLSDSPKGAHSQRGFSMALDGALEGRHPGIQLIIARDRAGRVQGFQRYVTAGGGTDLTLDVPWRRRGAPNGIDERMSVDMIAWSKSQGAQRLSLAFAAFPEIFDATHRGRLQRFCYAAIHLGDLLIALESLYRYLRKFRALGERRYVLLSLTQVLPLLVVLLSLEFLPRRRHLPHATASASTSR